MIHSGGFFDKPSHEAEWSKASSLTGFDLGCAKQVGRTLVLAAPSWFRSEHTPSFTIYPDGRAHDFGGCCPRSYSAFQLFLTFKDLSPDAPVDDPARVAAAREFWPEKYNKGAPPKRLTRQEAAEQKLQRDLKSFGSRQTACPLPSRPAAGMVAAVTEAWDSLAELVEPGTAFWNWILGRGFTREFIEPEIGISLFPLQLPRYPSLHQIDLFIAARLLKNNSEPESWASPFLRRNGCYLVSRYKVPGYTRGIVTGIRKRFFDSIQPKEAQVVTIEDCVLPGVRYLWSGFDWCTVARARGQIVILTESHLDRFAVQLMLSAFAQTNGDCQRLHKEHRFLVLGLNGVGSYVPKILDLVNQAEQVRIALDSDAAGKTLAQRILGDCQGLGIPATDCTSYPAIFGDRKDPNEILKSINLTDHLLLAAAQHFTGLEFQ